MRTDVWIRSADLAEHPIAVRQIDTAVNGRIIAELRARAGPALLIKVNVASLAPP